MTRTQVRLGNRNITLTNKNVIGAGGEATVFKHQNIAVKVYHQPDPQREAKLRAFLPEVAALPSQVVAPLDLVADPASGRAVGFTMPLLPAGFTELRQLSVKKFRVQANLISRDIAQRFIVLHRVIEQIHAAGMVIGDFNDLNVMFCGDDIRLIDVDSFQFGNFPCVVGTEQFIPSVLYNVDLSAGPAYRPEHDWYAFAVLLFKSLLMTHPYGGVHPKHRVLPARAQARITVLDSTVTYPRIANPPALLTSELQAEFDAWFSGGKLDVFPVNVLKDYVTSLKSCGNCSETYPATDANCPFCATAAPVVISAQVQAETRLQTKGDIILYDLKGKRLRVLAQEDGLVVYYDASPVNGTRRVPLFDTMPHATYVFVEEYLVISPAADSDALMVVDVSGDAPAPVLQTTTTRLGGGKPVFGSSGRNLYRLSGSFLMQGHIEHGQLVERAVMSVVDEQTWFAVAPSSETVLGYYRIFSDYDFWLLHEGEQRSAEVTPLETGESLLQTHVQFGSSSLLVIRQTRLNGREQVRLDELDLKGRRLAAQVISPADDVAPIDTYAYSRGMLLRATDAGIDQIRLDTLATRTFTETEPIVRRGDSLTRYENGLLAVQGWRVLYLTL